MKMLMVKANLILILSRNGYKPVLKNLEVGQLDLIMNAPVVVKILASLTVILVGNRILKNLSFSVFLGILLLAFWSGHSLLTGWTITWTRISGRNQLFLYLVIFLVIGLSSQMKQTGTMDKLVLGVQSRTSRRGAMAVLPAVIGLLPMPGGAVFSAPLVDSCDNTGSIGNILKSRINYWFRHMWEFWWPLYPGVLLAVELSGMEVGKFSLLLFPMTIFYILGGYFFLLRKVPVEEKRDKNREGQIFRPVIPIIITLLVYIVIMILFPVVSDYSQYIPMAIGITISIIYLQITHPLDWSGWKSIIFSTRTLKLLLLVMLVRVYGAFIEAPLPDGIYLMEKMREELFSWGIPILLFTMVVPFVSGIATGIAIGTVGASFPIVLSLLGPDPEPAVRLSTILMAYSIGHAGMMLSPVHICLIVSNEYFETGVFRSLRGLIGPAGFVILSGFLISRVVLFIL